MKNKVKFIPVDTMDLFEMENYLSEMAARGYLVKKIGRLGHFEKVEPQKMNYHLAPFIEASKPADEQLESYQNNGWAYVCSIGRIFNIYQCAGENPIAIGEAPEELIKRYEMILHNLKGILWLNAIAFLIYLVLVFFNGILDETRIVSAVQYDTWWYMIVVLFTTSMSFRSNIRTKSKIKEIIYKLKLGVLAHDKLDDKTIHKAFIKQNIEIGIYVLLLIITAISLINSFTGGWEVPVSTYHNKLPIMPLQNIEQDVDFEMTHHLYGSRDYDDVITYKRSALARSIYEINQAGKVPGKIWRDSKYTPWIETEFYEVRLQAIAHPLLEDLIQRHVRFYDSEVIYQKLEDTGFDEAIYVKAGEEQMIFVCLEKKVMYTCYEGEQELKQYIKEIYDLVKAF